MTSKRLLYLAVIAASAALVFAYALREIWLGAALVGTVGLIWIIGLLLHWGWISSTLFLVFAVLNSILLLIQAPSYLEVISITAVLVAWDLSYFIGRLEKTRTPELARGLEINHLRRLLVIAGAGLLLMSAAILLDIQLSFAIALLLGGVGLLALIQVVSRLGYHVEKPRPGQPK
jgi:hypothetical protein